MFQLIVAVISIALFAALAIAAMWYGGDAFTKSSEKANVTTLINQAQQISGAAALYKTDTGLSIANFDESGGTTRLQKLVEDDYLATNPSPSKIADGATGWSIIDNTAGDSIVTVPFVAGVDVAEICDDTAGAEGEVYKQNGICTDAAGDAPATPADATNFAFPL